MLARIVEADVDVRKREQYEEVVEVTHKCAQQSRNENGVDPQRAIRSPGRGAVGDIGSESRRRCARRGPAAIAMPA